MITVKVTKTKGRGLFASKAIKKGTTIEIAELIVFHKDDSKKLDATLLKDYVYNYGGGRSCLVLGHGELFNHNRKNNVEHVLVWHEDRYVMHYIAKRNIKKGEELELNYGYDPK